LKDTFGVNAIRNLLLARELTRVLKQLGTAGVPVIPLKGVALAESLYGDTALRTCADLDILIQPQDLAPSLRILQSSGYDTHHHQPALVQLQGRFGKDCALMREDAHQPYPLQVHCGMIWGGPAERPVLAEIWSGAVPSPFCAAPTLALSPEWEFLYLAMHAARHGLFPFKWLVDLDWIVARGSVDWQKVHETTKRLGWQEAVYSCFAACASLLETPIPEPFVRPANAAPSRFSLSAPGPLQIPRETLFSVRLLPSLAPRLQFLAIRLFIPTPADGEFISLPSALFFLYYLLRPLRLAVTVAGWTIPAGLAQLRRLFRRGP
jgi:hypothetical protein